MGSLGVVLHSGSCEADVIEITAFAGMAASVARNTFLEHVTVFAWMALVALRKIWS